MAINPESQYPGKIVPSSSNYPYGQARNITTPGDGTGTPLEANWVNDLFGWQQALLSAAGIVPSNNPDRVGSSQYLQVLEQLFGRIFSNVSSMVAAAYLQSGATVFTLGYTSVADGGGATYRVKTAAQASSDGDTIDELGFGFTLANGNVAVLDYSNGVWVEQFGALKNTDDDSFCDALQAIIDASGDPSVIANPTPFVIRANPGVLYIRKSVWVNAVDGLKIILAGLFNTTLKISSSFSAGSVPGGWPSDGLDYTTEEAWLVFARLRNTGKSGAFIVPGSGAGAGAAWYYELSGFYLDAEAYSGGKAIHMVRAPEIANTRFRDIIGHKVKSLLNTDDALGTYACTWSYVQAWYSGKFFNANRGTSLLMDQCAAVNCDKGFDSRTNYTTYNACTVDNCGAGEYAWDLGGVGVVLNSPGAEYPNGGTFRVSGRGSEVVVNGGFLLGGSKVGESNYAGQATDTDFGLSAGEYLIQVDSGKCTFNRTVMRNITEAVPATIVHLNPRVTNGGRVTINGNTGEDFNEYVQPEDWIVSGFLNDSFLDRSAMDVVGESAQFSVATTADETIARNGTTQVQFINSPERRFDKGPSWFKTAWGLQPRTGGTITEYVVPHAGLYRFRFSGFIEDVDVGDYMFFSVTGETNRLLTISNVAGDFQVHLEDEFECAAGDIVRIFYRSFGTVTDPTIKAGARFAGGIMN